MRGLRESIATRGAGWTRSALWIGAAALAAAVGVPVIATAEQGGAGASGAPDPAPRCLGQEASIVGTPGNDRGRKKIVGTGKADVIVTLGGRDQIDAKGGRDLVCAGSGKDSVAGGADRDTLLGGGGGDRIDGGKGKDDLEGDAGNDRLNGGPGSDRCRGGKGKDRLLSCERRGEPDPIAADDTARTDEDSPTSIDVLENDYGRRIRIVSVDDAAATGSASVAPGGAGVDYDPAGGFEGLGAGDTRTDRFTYTIESRKGRRDRAGVTVVIDGVDDHPQPNIIVITTDDQHAPSMNPTVMPNVMRLIGDPGAVFESSVVATPLCCPSRATFLTGQYAHNHGVLWNLPGYPDLRDPGNTLPVWLRAAGYQTVHVGKYVRGYAGGGDPTISPPGWDWWATMLNLRYYDYVLAADGFPRAYGREEDDYLGSVLNDLAEDYVRRLAPRDEPLFMVLDQFAPHNWPGEGNVERCARPAPEPAVQDGDAFANTPLPSPPSMAEADVSDKPSFISGRPVPTAGEIAERERRYQCGLAALQEVDRGVDRIWRALVEIGEERDTVFVFTSDNGFYYGEHRLLAGADKALPYRESVEVPLAIRLPNHLRPPAARGIEIDGMVANVDLAPTLLELAGAAPCVTPTNCRTLDGRSLVPLLTAAPGASWPADRAIPLEASLGLPDNQPDLSCRYQGLWSEGDAYVHHTSASYSDRVCVPIDEVEHYDLDSDPFQLENLFPAPAGSAAEQRQLELAARAERLADCAGIAGRDPLPPGRSHCE